jgi:spermidine/putrescine transport system substrate-binding protein
MINLIENEVPCPSGRRRHIFTAGFILLMIFLGFCACEEKKPVDRDAARAFIDAYNLSAVKDKLGKTLHIFNFPDYLNRELIEQFEKTYGVDIIQDYYDTNEVLIAKLQAGGAGQYDIIVASDFAVSILMKKNALEPLEKNNIPNIKNLDERFRDLPFDPGNRYSVCYTWGTTGFGIRTDLIDAKDKDKKIDTWKVLFDPAYQLGPFVMLDDPRETIGAALKYLGYSVNTVDEKELQEAGQLLIAQKKRILAYTSLTTGRDLLISGDVVVCHNFSGDIFMAKEEKDSIDYVVPEEGAVIWTDNVAIPVRAPHKYTAEVFINYMLDARIGAKLTNFTHYASPNRAALPYIDPGIRDNPGIFPPGETIRNLEFLRDVGEAARLYDAVWTRVKASSK